MMGPAQKVIRVRVDPLNPGQFFACCGLLELASRLWGEAEGWFQADQFNVATIGTMREILEALVRELPEEITRLDDGLEIEPLIAPLCLGSFGASPNPLILDRWMSIIVDKGKAGAAGNPPWNFWSGQQTSLRIWSALRDALSLQLTASEAIFSDSVFEERVALSGRFGFDPRAAWNALDVGFSPNEQKMDVASSPAVEMLAAIGIQRCCPSIANDRMSFDYSTWGRALPPSIASAAACAAIHVPPAIRFCGHVVSRGSYAALGYSMILKGTSNE